MSLLEETTGSGKEVGFIDDDANLEKKMMEWSHVVYTWYLTKVEHVWNSFVTTSGTPS